MSLDQIPKAGAESISRHHDRGHQPSPLTGKPGLGEDLLINNGLQPIGQVFNMEEKICIDFHSPF